MNDSYRRKLLHNYHELSALERWRYLVLDRRRLNAERRFFFEGCRRIPGQMYVADRKGLHDVVLGVRPTHCFEIGTFTGGGSTFFLASALARLGKGKVVTLEADGNLRRGALAAYRKWLPHLLPFVEFVHGDDVGLFEPYLSEAGGAPCVFLDGADDARQAVDQFRFFEGHFGPGAVLMAHDWNTEKMRLLRPLLVEAGGWRCRMLLEEPESVGFAVFEYRGSGPW